MRTTTLLVACLICLAATTARASDLIKPYLSDQAVGVVRVDLTGADFPGLVEVFIAAVDKAGLDADAVAELRESAREGIQEFSEQLKTLTDAGVREVFIVGSFQLMSDPILFVIPHHGNPNAVVEALNAMEMNAQTKVVGPVVLAAGSEQALNALTALPPSDRSDLLQALDNTGNGPMRAAISPGKQLRDIFEQMAANLPAEMGGDPITVLTRGAMSIEASFAAAPDSTIRLTIRAESPEAAAALRRWIAARFDQVQRDEGIDFSPLLPEHEADTLKLTIDADRRVTVAKALLPSLLQSREAARRVQSATNVKGQTLSLQLWSSEHKNEWPATLEEAIDNYAGKEPLIDMGQPLTNPRRADRPQPHYIYIRPADSMDRLQKPAERLVIYEAFEEFGKGVIVGFADGHVEWVADEAKFKELLKTAQDNAAKE